MPLPLRLRLLLGGGLNQVLWGLTGLAALFVVFLGAGADFRTPLLLMQDRKPVNGTLLAVRKTHLSEGRGGSRRHMSRSRPVFAYDYKFTAADGREYTGVSYNTGAASRKAGDPISIEYYPPDPDISRAMGMDAAPAASWFGSLVAAAVAVLGLALLLWRAYRGQRRVGLLKNGEFTRARLVDRRKLDMHVNKRPVYEYQFEFKTRTGHTVRTTTRTVETMRVEDETREPLLYDRDRPQRTLLLDELESPIGVTPDGRVQAPASGYLSVVIPLLAIVVPLMLWPLVEQYRQVA